MKRNSIEQEIADSRAKRIAGGGPRHIVDGHETANEESPFMGDGKFPPFVIFDVDEQRNLFGAYQTREDAEKVAAVLNGGHNEA